MDAQPVIEEPETDARTQSLDFTQDTQSSPYLRKGESLCCGIFEKDESDPDFGCLVGPLLLSVLIVVCGTASTVTSKIQYEVRSHGLEKCYRHDDDDDYKTHKCPFTKPWFQTLVMKLAMSLCYFLSKFTQWYRQRSWEKEKKVKTLPLRDDGDSLETSLLDIEHHQGGYVPDYQILQSPRERFPKPSTRAIFLIMLPAMTDLLQTVLSQAGLLWVTSSTYQMMRGSVIIFTAFMSVRYMGKVMTSTHWAAVGITCLAIAIVGIAGIFGEESGNTSIGTYILGIGLIVLGQVVGAIQFVLEEYLMTEMNVTPTLLVGWEGIWGTLYFVVLAPALTFTPRGPANDAASAIWHESFADTWVQLKNSDALIILTAISAVALLVYNLVGNMVTKQLSAVVRSILESCRTLGVWATGLVLWYVFDDHDAGENWTYFSLLEAFGFMLLVYGTIAYRGIVPIPGFPRINT
mmetsp:Transcript_4167/g.5852  ORF Transcript_4167/g.5852 Transcript_4167/m.5852 type:complete len:463 (-) Transcript_4167:1013-2401(-)